MELEGVLYHLGVLLSSADGSHADDEYVDACSALSPAYLPDFCTTVTQDLGSFDCRCPAGANTTAPVRFAIWQPVKLPAAHADDI